MLKEFDEAATGMSKGETKSFPLKFPDDYHGKEVAGNLATITKTLRDVAAPEVPELNEAFAKSLGVESGDINKLREDVEKNLRREVTARCKAKVKNSVMEALLETADFGVPKAMIETESQRLADNARKDLAARGMNVKDAPIPPELFKDQAAKRVRLGLLVAEVVKQKNLKAAEEQVRAFVEDLASSYESPGEFVNWYLGDANRRAEAEAVVIEENVVNWVLGVAKVTDDAISVETLLLQTAQAQA
jgi:trigger factor